VIDLHSHVLPGLDDGAADLDEAVDLCRAAAADGIEAIAGTPHVRFDYPTTAASMEASLARLQEAVGGLIRVLPGGELDIESLDLPVEELRRFGLGGNPDYLLVETPYRGWPALLGTRLVELRARGVTPVLAHPERNREVQTRPELLEPLVAGGVLIQLTASSVDGREGRRAKSCARTLLGRGLAHLIASDAHRASIRAVGMAAAARSVGDPGLARWLTVDVPRAIVDGGPLPVRPELRRRSFLRL
jgi:protein-tyrosine phosphatase